jgi:hypothetical protein
VIGRLIKARIAVTNARSVAAGYGLEGLSLDLSEVESYLVSATLQLSHRRGKAPQLGSLEHELAGQYADQTAGSAPGDNGVEHVMSPEDLPF